MVILRIHTRIFSRSLGTDRNNMKHYVRLRRQDDPSIRFLVRILAPCICPRLDNNRRRKITLLHKKKKMSLHSTPILYLNMGGEMLYILRQRLKAQKIDADKTIQGENEHA